MQGMFNWLENHDKLAGWAQFLGAIIALVLTYVTAFAPHWRRKRQLRAASERVLSHGYETVESFHRTSAFFLPQRINIRAATTSMRSVINELNKFPIYEMDSGLDQVRARRIVAISFMLEGICLILDDLAERLSDGQMSVEDRDFMRVWIGDRLNMIADLLAGRNLERPQASDFVSS
ncbi:hypothetical protein [Sphingomonas sp. PB1R3]|uniref:hypothetical protein n=1 Tax=Sphingomonas flavida TaxID=3096154 RepID=UPI002FC9154B